MFSGAVDLSPKLAEENRADLPLSSARWEHFPFSELSHHGRACCDIAREWVIANDFAQMNGGDATSGPRWLRARYNWGPSPWPAHWCEIVERKVIDCGAHSALAHEVFLARGLIAFRAQFVQSYCPNALGQWRKKWSDEGVSGHWLGDDNLIYHEANALLLADDEIKLWDSSAGWWLNPRQQGGYGSLVALRIFAGGHPAGGDGFRWGDRRVRPNEWVQIADQATGPRPLTAEVKRFIRK